MPENSDRINQLVERLEQLSRQQEFFSREIYALRNELYQLKADAGNEVKKQSTPKDVDSFINSSGFKRVEDPVPPPVAATPASGYSPAAPVYNLRPASQQLPVKSSLEKFIGENLINKIGIGITIIGVAIGAKYSIEHELISPLTRIILGYLMGLGLMFFGIRLKAKYENYSAVLVSGAMAIFYFITYAAYSFYNLFPQLTAFILMLFFTVFTVIAAISYNKQVIAQIGLVGAYAVPFLLSDGSGKVAILFSYMAIINSGILVIAIKKYWKPLYYSSFILTWLIFSGWYIAQYKPALHFNLALFFAAVFFIIFYLIFLGYKLLNKEKFVWQDILLLLANAFIYYAIVYNLFLHQSNGEQYLGLFTLCNAGVHFLVSIVIFRQKLADQNLFLLVSGLSLIFVTITIPVQLNGNWVTLLWAGEAWLLFWIGRTREVPVYQRLSYPLMLLAFISLLQDWYTAYDVSLASPVQKEQVPLLNISFFSAMLFVGAFAGIYYISRNKKYDTASNTDKYLTKIFSFIIPAILLFTIYYAFRIEIARYWNQVYSNSALFNKESREGLVQFGNPGIKAFKTIWIINYTLFFFSLLSFINIKKIKDHQLAFINLLLNTMVTVVFLLQGLYVLSELRDNYLARKSSTHFQITSFHIGVRYVSFLLATLLLACCYQYMRSGLLRVKLIWFDLLLHITILWIASSELITWMAISRSDQSYKLGLSILWGLYALFLIALGIWKNKQYLRVGAIILFGVTLIKLFFYDIADLNTIAKTIVFVSLGILLLIISFLYNKYKHIISDE